MRYQYQVFTNWYALLSSITRNYLSKYNLYNLSNVRVEPNPWINLSMIDLKICESASVSFLRMKRLLAYNFSLFFNLKRTFSCLGEISFYLLSGVLHKNKHN